MVTDTADEVSQDETSLHEESEPEQEVFTNPSIPQVLQPVYPRHVSAIYIGSKNGLDGKQCTLP